MKRGDICLAHFPFTDGSAAKLRPILIVSGDQFNSREDVVVLPISSSPDDADPYCVYLDNASPHFRQSGLRFSSAIKCTKPMTIAKSVITRRLGRLHEAILQEATRLLVDTVS
jgi:mRNA interferase MazF